LNYNTSSSILTNSRTKDKRPLLRGLYISGDGDVGVDAGVGADVVLYARKDHRGVLAHNACESGHGYESATGVDSSHM